MQNPEETIVELRREIDAIDANLVELMAKRAKIAQAIGQAKGGKGVYRPERECVVLDRAIEHAEAVGSPISAEQTEHLFRELMGVCRSLENPVSVAYLGPAGTFCEMAARKQFSASSPLVPCVDIDAAFNAAEAGRADYAVVPIENSNQGTVARTLDLLMRTPLFIIAEVRIPVVHNLLSCAKSLSELERVTAHPQALSQCHNWLKAHVPQAELVPASSNAAAAAAIVKDPKAGAIAAESAAAIYGLSVLGKSIQDNPNNETRFIVLGRDVPGRCASRTSKTSLLFSVANRAGALFEALQPFQKFGVSMDKLESRPSQLRPWEYNFFVDLEGHVEDEHLVKALQAVKEKTSFFKLLGSYPKCL